MNLQTANRWIKEWTELRGKYSDEPDHVAYCDKVLSWLRGVHTRELHNSTKD